MAKQNYPKFNMDELINSVTKEVPQKTMADYHDAQFKHGAQSSKEDLTKIGNNLDVVKKAEIIAGREQAEVLTEIGEGLATLRNSTLESAEGLKLEGMYYDIVRIRSNIQVSDSKRDHIVIGNQLKYKVDELCLKLNKHYSNQGMGTKWISVRNFIESAIISYMEKFNP